MNTLGGTRLAWALFGAALPLLFALVLWAGLWGNGFPSAWHNDEPGKIRQVQQGARNLHHPPLMLDLVALGAHLSGMKGEPEAIARLGRGLSVLCLALAAVGLALLAARLAGPAAGLVAGATLGTHPLLVECAHYFKEDSPHLLGMVLALLAAQVYTERPGSRWRAIFLGVVLAFCVATKHSGWLLVGVLGAAAVVFPWPERPRWKLVLGAFAAGFTLFAWTLIWQLPMAVGEIFWELRKLGGGDYGTGLETPHLLYLWVIYHDFGVAGCVLLLGLLIAGLTWLVRGRKTASLAWRRDFAVHVAVVYAVLYLVLLSFTAKFSDRYAIPLIVVIALGLGVGGARIGAWLLGVTSRRREMPDWARQTAPVAGLAAVLLLLAPDRAQDLRQRLAGFSRDSHEDLARYIRQRTPLGSVIAADAMALSAQAPLGSRRAVLASWFAADLGSLEDLAARGVRYVAFSRDVAHRYYETDWARGLLRDSNPAAAEAPRPLDLHRVQFYRTLASAGPEPTLTADGQLELRLVWSAPYSNPRPLHPGLFLIEISPRSAGETSVPALTTAEP